MEVVAFVVAFAGVFVVGVVELGAAEAAIT